MAIHPLDGVRIIDFSWQMAGPYGTTLLAMMGAEVIKVESLRHLDAARRPPSHSLDPELINRVARFNDNNLNKLSVNLDLTQPEAVATVKRLVQLSDAVVQNMRPGTMDRLGLGYSVLRKVKPDVIMLSLSSMGAEGPERRYAGYAAIFAALSGLSDATGYPDGIPTEGRATIDASAATTLAFALAAALFYRKQTGEGQHIDLSAREAVSNFVGEMYLGYAMNRRSSVRQGNQDEVMAPHNVYPCRGEDAWISIAVGTEQEWRAFCRALGHEEWTKDERFADAYRRWEHRDVLDGLIREWTKLRPPYDAMRLLQDAGVAAAPSFSSKDLYTDPHMQARGVYTTVRHRALGDKVVMGPQWKLSRTPAEVTGPAPLFGEHNRHVLGGLLGLADREIEDMISRKVVY